MKVNSKDMLKYNPEIGIFLFFGGGGGFIFIANYFQMSNIIIFPFGRQAEPIPASLHLHIVRLCWLAGAVVSTPEAQRTSLYHPPSLYQHFHIPSPSLTPPLSSPPLSAALVSLQLCFKSSVLHLLFYLYVFALLSPTLISISEFSDSTG